MLRSRVYRRLGLGILECNLLVFFQTIPMNGYHQKTNFASSSSNPYPDFQNLNSNDFSIHQQQPLQLPQSQWSAPMRSNSLHLHQRQPPQHHQQQQRQQQHHQQPHHQQQQHQHFNPPLWSNGPNQTPNQPFPSGNIPIGALNMPFISQQIIQDAFAMSAPVQAADEKILLQALLDSRTKKETYKDALNSLHGVCSFIVAYHSRALSSLPRKMAILPVSGRITIWNTKSGWTTG
jgi:hypothetical protein